MKLCEIILVCCVNDAINCESTEKMHSWTIICDDYDDNVYVWTVCVKLEGSKHLLQAIIFVII